MRREVTPALLQGGADSCSSFRALLRETVGGNVWKEEGIAPWRGTTDFNVWSVIKRRQFALQSLVLLEGLA